MKTWLSIFFFLFLSSSIRAQYSKTDLAFPGPSGIYVVLGNDLPSLSHPTPRGGIAYLVERRSSVDAAWREITTVGAPTSLVEFQTKLESAMKIVPTRFPLRKIPIDTLWQRMRASTDTTPLKTWAGVLVVRLASGMMIFDSTAERGVKYKYRISLIDQSKRALTTIESNEESYPRATVLPKLHLFKKLSDSKHVAFEWTAGVQRGISTFKVFRQDSLHGDFRFADGVASITHRNDSTFCLVQDTSVKAMEVYRYYLLPMDYYGNLGEMSDTALTGTYHFQQVPLPDSLHIVSRGSSGGIRVAWRLRDSRLVRDLTIYKSTHFDSGYVWVAHVNGTDTAFVDQNVEPMVNYFYYIIMNGPLGETSGPSAKVFGMFIDPLPPFAPGISGVIGTARGVKFNVVTTDNRQKYFQIFRNDGATPELELVSGLVKKTGAQTVYEDTSSTLTGKYTYSYSVRAENASHIFSPFSDTVRIRPNIPTRPPAPLGLTATVEGNTIQLYWNDMRAVENTICGYFVFRRALSKDKKESEFVRLNDTLLSATRNRYTDTTAELGKNYEYVIRAKDFYEGESPASITVQAGISRLDPVPPRNLRAMATSLGVLIQWDETVQPDLKEYRVYRYERGKESKLISTVAVANNLEATDTQVKAGGLYFYYVTSVTTGGVESIRSSEVGIRK